jgi:cytochrome c oxidase cbb3-type subunit 3
MRTRIGLLFVICLMGWLWAAAPAEAQEPVGDPKEGGELYVENCAMCHGTDGKGRVGASLSAFPGIKVDSALKQSIKDGVEGSVMPAWGQASGGPLTDQEIDDIVAYIIAAFGGTAPLAPAPTYQAPTIPPLPAVEGDPSTGSLVYQANCKVCHGDRGEGRFGSTLAKAWSGNQTAVYVQQVVREGVQGSTMPAWADENGGPLSEEMIRDVTAFVLSLSPVETQPEPAQVSPGPLNRTVSLVLLGVLVVIFIVGLIIYYRNA